MVQRTDDISDEQLVFMINEHNEDAKDILYERYKNLIYSELNNVKRSTYLLGIDPQDLNQEAMLGLANAISSFDNSSEVKFSTYVTVCIRHRLYNYIRKFTTRKSIIQKFTLSIDSEDRENIMNLKAPTYSEPLNKILISESLSEVQSKMNNELTEEEQLILDFSINGLKPEQIAKLINKNIKQVYNILYRARQKLK